MHRPHWQRLQKRASEVQIAFDAQKAEFKRRFQCATFVDPSHPLFSSETAAFLHKKQRWTKKIRFNETEEGARYFTHEFDELKFRRDAIRTRSTSSANNSIHLSDDSDESASPAQLFSHSLTHSHHMKVLLKDCTPQSFLWWAWCCVHACCIHLWRRPL